MARPRTLTDADIIAGALRVMARQGYDAFTLSDVAREIGLSRPAIHKRFKSTRALKIHVATMRVDAFIERLEAIPVERSGDGLLQLVEFMGTRTHSQTDVVRFFEEYRANMEDPKLAAVERRRGEAWTRAIEARMPQTVLPTKDAARSFGAVLSGAVTQWQLIPKTSGKDFLRKQAENWLILARIAFAEPI